MMQISLRHIPGTSALFADYLEDWPRVQRFYPHNYSLDAIAEFTRQRPRPDELHVARLCGVLSEQQKSWGSGQRGVEKLRTGAVAVVTGQQPVVFTGPHLSILKAITAIQLARRLGESGIPATPVFWVAAEDHDHAELESTWILNRDSRLSRVAVNLATPEPMPAGWLQFREDVIAASDECLSSLPQSEFTAEVREILVNCYQPGCSPVEAFARMMARLFAGTELTFVNPLHPELRRLAQPTIDAAICKNAEMRAAVIDRSRALSEAGYHEQVRVDDQFTGLFAYHGRSRQVLKPNEVAPDMEWSPNVLLRPVVQDTIFPTAAYIGCSAEIAYFAQAAPVYKTLGLPMPPIFPRISATIVEPRIVRALEKYDISFMDVFRGPEFLKRKAVEATQDGALFDNVRERVEAEMESLRSVLGTVDPTLLGALDTSRHKMLHQVETLRTKYVNAATKRNETVERHLESLAALGRPVRAARGPARSRRHRAAARQLRRRCALVRRTR